MAESPSTPKSAQLGTSLANSGLASSSTIQTKSIPLLSSLNQTSSIKLDRTNFRLWFSLVLRALRGHRLDDYVLGLRPCPPEFVTDDAGVRIHPEFDVWRPPIQSFSVGFSVL